MRASLATFALLLAAARADILNGQPYPAPAGYEEWISPIIQPFQPTTGSGDWSAAVAKAKKLVATLTNFEKVNMTTGIGINGRCVGNTGTIPRIGFEGLCLQDSPLGVRFADFVSAFPAGINVASTWDPSLMLARGQAMGAEFHGKGVNVALGPMTNMGRVAAGGRNWEGFGEEPFLSGIAAAETVKGIQSNGVIACVKHFVGNEQEHERGQDLTPAYSSNIDDRTLHEVYTWPFANAIQAGVGSMMCSYNRVNQTFSCENSKILTGIAKQELNFQGFITSDWAALYDGIDPALAGTDMNMPGFFEYGSGHDDVPDPSTSYNTFWGANLIDAVNNGSLPQSRLDDMATRIFAAYYQLGQDAKNYPKVNFASTTLNTTLNGVVVNEHINVQGDHASLIREIGAASAILLKNVDHALPLKASAFKRWGIFGADAALSPDGPNMCGSGQGDHGCDEGTLAMGWGSGTTYFPYLIDPLSAIEDYVVANHPGAIVEPLTNQNNLAGIATVAARSDVCLVFANADSGEDYITLDGNEGDRNNLTLFQNGENVILATANNCANTVVVLHTVGPVIVESWIDHPNVVAVLQASLPGQESGNSLVDVLFGAVNPSARLPYTIARQRSDYPADVVYTDTGNTQITYSEGLNIGYRHFDAAGIEPRFEFGFGLSYTSFTYSGLSVSVISSGKREFFDLEGRAVNATKPAATTSSSSTTSKASTSASSSSSSAASTTTPSTTSTSSSTTAASATSAAPTTVFTPPADLLPGGPSHLWQPAVSVAFTVKNSGSVSGHEVPQVYLGFPAGSGEPPRVLRGFTRVLINKGASSHVTIQLLNRDISIWDNISQSWTVPAGQFTVYVGASSRDLRLKGTFSITKLPVNKASPPSGA